VSPGPTVPTSPGPCLPVIPFEDLSPVQGGEALGAGAFGTVQEMLWRGTPVAVKLNGVQCTDTDAIVNEQTLWVHAR
jgi:hypothetical protein